MSKYVAKDGRAPLCRWCGGPIAKHTTTVRFGPDAYSVWSDSRVQKDKRPMSKKEVQRYVNGKVVFIRWKMRRNSNDQRDIAYDEHSRHYIDTASVWDGESYVDPFFCTGTHAQLFGYRMAREGSATKAWQEAYNAQKVPT